MQIAVVGLGVAGATAATLLARQGHAVTVIEQAPSPGPVGAGILLQPSGQLVLQRLGLLDKVTARAERIDRLFALTHRGRTLIDLPYRELSSGLSPHPCAFGVHRGELFMALFDELQQSGVTLRTNTRPVRVRRSPTAATLLDADNSDLGDFDFILACDGARSALRESSDIPARVFQYPHGALWAIGRSTFIRNQLWQVTRGTKHLCGLLPMGENRCSLFWSLAASERDSFFARGFDYFRREVLALCPEADELLSSLRSFDDTRFTSYFHITVPRPFSDRLLLLGDAAHAMSPHLGQGINLALLDAYCFAYALHTTQEFAAACDLYTRLRQPHVRAYALITRTLSPFFQSKGRIKAILRDLFLPLMPHLPPLRKTMIITMAGLRATLPGGHLQLPRDPTPAHAPEIKL